MRRRRDAEVAHHVRGGGHHDRCDHPGRDAGTPGRAAQDVRASAAPEPDAGRVHRCRRSARGPHRGHAGAPRRVPRRQSRERRRRARQARPAGRTADPAERRPTWATRARPSSGQQGAAGARLTAGLSAYQHGLDQPQPGRPGQVHVRHRVAALRRSRKRRRSGWADPATTCLHTGSLATVLAPGADDVAAIVHAARQTSTVSFDPNCRPTLIEDVRVGPEPDPGAGRRQRHRQGEPRGSRLAVPRAGLSGRRPGVARAAAASSS